MGFNISENKMATGSLRRKLRVHIGNHKHEAEREQEWYYELSEPAPSRVPPPSRLHLLNLLQNTPPFLGNQVSTCLRLLGIFLIYRAGDVSLTMLILTINASFSEYTLIEIILFYYSFPLQTHRICPIVILLNGCIVKLSLKCFLLYPLPDLFSTTVREASSCFA